MNIKFRGQKLADTETLMVEKHLRDTLSDILEEGDLDEHIDGHGYMILSDRWSIQDVIDRAKLKKVV